MMAFTEIKQAFIFKVSCKTKEKTMVYLKREVMGEPGYMVWQMTGFLTETTNLIGEGNFHSDF